MLELLASFIKLLASKGGLITKEMWRCNGIPRGQNGIIPILEWHSVKLEWHYAFSIIKKSIQHYQETIRENQVKWSVL